MGNLLIQKMKNTLKTQQQTEPIEYFIPYSFGFKFNYLEAQENFAEELLEDLG